MEGGEGGSQPWKLESAARDRNRKEVREASSRFRGVRPMEAPEENSLREQALSGMFPPVLPHGRWRGRQSAMEARIRREGQNGKEVREAPSHFRGVRPMEAP